MTLALLAPMAAFALAASISPGPVNLMCLSTGTRHPLASGLPFVTGTTLGFIALFLAIGLGLFALLALVPGLQEALRWAGIASADPILQAPSDLQSYNRHAYVRNNPLTLTDPSGFSWWGKQVRICLRAQRKRRVCSW